MYFWMTLTIKNKAIHKCAELSIYYCYPNHRNAFQLLLIAIIINRAELENIN